MARSLGVLGLGLLLVGCAAGGANPPAARPGRVAVNVAALNLVGVGDVVWDVEVVSGAGPVV